MPWLPSSFNPLYGSANAVFENWSRCRRLLSQALKTSVVSNSVKIQRLGHLHIESRRVADGLTSGKPVGVIRRGQRSHSVAIERVFGVHMQVAKERFALGGRCRWVGQNWHRGRAFWPLSQHGFFSKTEAPQFPSAFWAISLSSMSAESSTTASTPWTFASPLNASLVIRAHCLSSPRDSPLQSQRKQGMNGFIVVPLFCDLLPIKPKLRSIHQ